jgi:hypothetical protein
MYVVEVRGSKGWEVQLETADDGEAFGLVDTLNDGITEWRLSCERVPENVVVDLQAQVRRSASARTRVATAMVAACQTH